MKSLFKSIAELVKGEPQMTIKETATEETTLDAATDAIVAEIPAEQTATEQADDLGNEPAAEIATLAEGMVAVNAAELETLKANAAKWEANATEFANLKAWKKSADESTELVDTGGADADQATAEKPKPKSYLQQIADQRSRVGKR